MQNTLVLLPLDEEYRKRIMAASQGKSDVVFCDSSWTRDEYISALQCADVLLGDPEPEDLNACQNLRWMQTTWSGVRQYVTCEVFRQGAVLCNMTGAYGPAIAEHEMAMILALCKRLPQYQNHQSRGLWKMAGFDKTLEGSTVLILGAGDIGCELAKRLRPFVKKIIGIRRREREYPDYFDEMITLNDLDQCLPLADVVSCSLPDTLEARHLLDKRRLHLMKKDAILINVGRGNLIVTEDLLEVLKEGMLWGVGLDVTDPEPLPQYHSLWKQPRVMITPHVSGNVHEQDSPSICRILDFVVQNYEKYMQGKDYENIVDIDVGYRKG